MKKYLAILTALAFLGSCNPSNPEFEKNISGSWYGVGITGISNELVTESADSGLAQMIEESVDLLDDFWWNFDEGKASLKPGARPAAAGTYKIEIHDDAHGNPMTVQTAYKLVRTGLEPSWEQ